MYRLLAWLTDGRPMKKGDFRFRDSVSGKAVHYYHDYYGRTWLADNDWGFFRVAVDPVVWPECLKNCQI